MSLLKVSLLTKFKRDEIAALFHIASVLYKSSDCVILCAPATLSYGRLLLVIPKKIGSAPIRNTLRRRLKAIFYEERLFELGYDMVFIAKQKEITQRSFLELKELLVRESGKLKK